VSSFENKSTKITTMYRGSTLSVQTLSAKTVVGNSTTATYISASNVNFATLTVTSLLPTGTGTVTYGNALAQNVFINGTVITIGGDNMPVSITCDRISAAKTTQIATIDSNILLNNGQTALNGTGLYIVNNMSTFEGPRMRINSTFEWEVRSPNRRLGNISCGIHVVSTLSCMHPADFTFTSLTGPSQLNLNPTGVFGVMGGGRMSVQGELKTTSLAVAGTFEMGTLTAIAFALPNTVQASMITCDSFTFAGSISVRLPTTQTGVTGASMVTVQSTNASLYNVLEYVSTPLFVTRTSLSIGTLNARSINCAYLAAATDTTNMSATRTYMTMSGLTRVSTTTSVANAFIWSYTPTTSMQVNESAISLVGILTTENLSVLNTATLQIVNRSYVTNVSSTLTRVRGEYAHSNPGGQISTYSMSSATGTITNLVCSTVTFGPNANVLVHNLLSALSIGNTGGVIVNNTTVVRNVFGNTYIQIPSLSAVTVNTDTLVAPNFPVINTSMSTFQLSVLSRTQVQAIRFLNATGTAFRTEYGSAVVNPPALTGGVVFTSLFATALPSVVLQVPNDVICVLSGSISSRGAAWFCANPISQFQWIAIGY
jgi:hypothetical protein